VYPYLDAVVGLLALGEEVGVGLASDAGRVEVLAEPFRRVGALDRVARPRDEHPVVVLRAGRQLPPRREARERRLVERDLDRGRRLRPLQEGPS
jgi:hypothetical protein